MSVEKELRDFLVKVGVTENCIDHMIEEGMTLPVLLQTNEDELAILAPKLVDKIKIRTALDTLRNNINLKEIVNPIILTSPSENSTSVALPYRQSAVIVPIKTKENVLLQ
ncbi:hypothetical protein ABMA27_000156, partial [Loxostege sticticalis]